MITGPIDETLDVPELRRLAGLTGPYRLQEERLELHRNRVEAIVQLHRLGVADWRLRYAADSCGQMDVFESVRVGSLTPEEAAWFLSLNSRHRPWYERFLGWLLGVLSQKVDFVE